MGGYTYGAGLQASSGTNGTKAPLHAALSIGTGSTPSWTAGYDTAGDMTCRTAPSVPSSGATCTSVFSAQAPVQRLLDDSEGRLVGWQVSASGATTSLLYDGAGNRVEQVVPPGCSLDCFTSTTVYQGGVQEQFRSGQITRLTKYEPTGVSGVTALSSSTGTYSYLASDGLGSVSAALSSSGSVTATQLYAPYGTVRYASGAMPGTLGYTGQHDDGPGGLLYYGARYYDPAAGQFTSADTVLAGGLNRYGYVGDNPETATDPSGHDVDGKWGFDALYFILQLALNVYTHVPRAVSTPTTEVQQVIEQVSQTVDPSGNPTPDSGADIMGGNSSAAMGTPEYSYQQFVQYMLTHLGILKDGCNPMADPNCPGGPGGGAGAVGRSWSRNAIPPKGTQRLRGGNGGNGQNPFNREWLDHMNVVEGRVDAHASEFGPGSATQEPLPATQTQPGSAQTGGTQSGAQSGPPLGTMRALAGWYGISVVAFVAIYAITRANGGSIPIDMFPQMYREEAGDSGEGGYQRPAA